MRAHFIRSTSLRHLNVPYGNYNFGMLSTWPNLSSTIPYKDFSSSSKRPITEESAVGMICVDNVTDNTVAVNPLLYLLISILLYMSPSRVAVYGDVFNEGL